MGQGSLEKISHYIGNQAVFVPEETMSSAPLFSDRADAGEQLAQAIHPHLNQIKAAGVDAPPIVYGLPRGGLPVAAPVARDLDCPLDIVVAKKISTEQNPELAIGAVTAQGTVLWSRHKLFGKKNVLLLETSLHQAQAKAQALLTQLAPGCPQVNPQGRLALLVDDGIATGMTMAAAAQALKAQNPAQLWVCAPVAPVGLAKWLSRWCDRIILLETPDPFLSVSRFYKEFPQLTTEEALSYLQQHNHPLTINS